MERKGEGRMEREKQGKCSDELQCSGAVLLSGELVIEGLWELVSDNFI